MAISKRGAKKVLGRVDKAKKARQRFERTQKQLDALKRRIAEEKKAFDKIEKEIRESNRRKR
jgi:septal ring factor EnvC (AmiA/AmiB activator)